MVLQNIFTKTVDDKIFKILMNPYKSLYDSVTIPSRFFFNPPDLGHFKELINHRAFKY